MKTVSFSFRRRPDASILMETENRVLPKAGMIKVTHGGCLIKDSLKNDKNDGNER